MPDGAIFPACINRLQANQKTPLMLSIKHFLEFANSLIIAFKLFQSTLLALVAVGEIGIEISQADFAAGLDKKLF
jgi:hypothetical protein